MFTWFLAGAFDAAAVPLPRAIEEVLADEKLTGASVGLVVFDEDGELWYAHDPDRRLVPASTAKWVTAAAAARDLGLDFTFTTTLAVTGTAEGGALQGDVVVIGGGDPSFGDGDPYGAVDRLVQLVRAAGIERVDGKVVVDASASVGPPYGPGWMWDDLDESYSPPYGAVNFNRNLMKKGMPCEAQDGSGSPLKDPALCLANTLRAELGKAGIKVAGPAAVEARPEAARIGVVRSEPLWMLLDHMLLESDNLYAECVARALDRVAPADDAGARERVAALLADAGIPAGDVKLVDGSGLSRYSLVSARQFATLTAWVAEQPWGRSLVTLLPVAGRSGTLEGRLVGTPAEGRLYAKTGSMSGVRNLVGFVDTADGHRLAFAFLINGFVMSQSDAISVQDRILALLAASEGRKALWLVGPERGRIASDAAEALTAAGG